MSNTEAVSAWKRMLKKQALCTNCKKQDAYTLSGRWLCYECEQAAIERQRQRRAQPGYNHEKWLEVKAKQWERREQGLCFRCGRELTDSRYKTCARCRAKASAKKRQKTVEDAVNWPIGANGYCSRCNKQPAKTGSKLCEQCYQITRENLNRAWEKRDTTKHYWRKDETARLANVWRQK